MADAAACLVLDRSISSALFPTEKERLKLSSKQSALTTIVNNYKQFIDIA